MLIPKPSILLTKAKAGDAEAQNALGEAYLYGRTFRTRDYGLEQDYAQAKTWFMKSAMQGNWRAEMHLGNIYYHGYGVAKDNQKAYFWAALARQRFVTFLKDGEPNILPCGIFYVYKDSGNKLSTTKRAAQDKRVQEWKPASGNLPE